MLQIIGDLHIGKSNNAKQIIGSSLNSRVIDQFSLLDFCLDQAINNHCNDIVITGDIFDEVKPAPYLITLFIDWLKKCQINQINTHLIMGNHDVMRIGQANISCLDIIKEIEMDYVSVYKDIQTIFINNTAITMLPFRDRKFYSSISNSEALSLLQESLVYELASIPLNFQKIVIGHFAMEGAIPANNELDLANELLCSKAMFKGYDITIMGHIHRPQIIQDFPYISHIGSLDISDFGETDHTKRINLIDTQKKSLIKEIILPTRQFRVISLTVPEDVQDANKYVLDELTQYAELDNATIKIEVALPSTSSFINKNEIEKLLSSKGVFNITNISQSKKSNIVKKNKDKKVSIQTDTLSSIKTFAELNVPVELREDYINIATDILNQLKSEEKN